MEVKGITADSFAQIVLRVSTGQYAGNVVPEWIKYGRGAPTVLNAAGTRWRGRIVVHESSGRGARRSWSGRRMPVACWHVFRDVFRLALAQHPDAVIRTAMARYTSANFETAYPMTGMVNVGSQMQPAYMPDLCDCSHDERVPEPTLVDRLAASYRTADDIDLARLQEASTNLRIALDMRKSDGPPCGWCGKPTPGDAFAWCGPHCQDNWQYMMSQGHLGEHRP